MVIGPEICVKIDGRPPADPDEPPSAASNPPLPPSAAAWIVWTRRSLMRSDPKISLFAQLLKDVTEETRITVG